MSLINELQESIEHDDVILALRKAKRLAIKLDQLEMIDWIESELEGYIDSTALPEYRKISTTLAYDTNGYVPMGMGYMGKGRVDLPNSGLEGLRIEVHNPISLITTWVKSLEDKNAIYNTLQPEASRILKEHYSIKNDPELVQRVVFLQKLNDSEVVNILQSVKNKLHTWACSLESKGITGENMSFSEKTADSALISVNVAQGSINQDSSVVTNSEIDQFVGKGSITAQPSPYEGRLKTTIYVIGAIASIVGAWWFAWDKWDWWFFGLQKNSAIATSE